MSGEHAKLRRRQFDVLMYLAQRHDRVVSKDELINANWHGVTVSDDSLTKCISEIRQALGPGLRDSLKTLAARGYMLTGWQVGVRGELRSSADLGMRRLPAVKALVGRDADIDRVVSLIGRARLVTIIGSGGVGKTSLATAVAHVVAADFADGASFVALAPLLAGGSVGAAVLATLRIAASGDPLETVLADVMDKRLLLVLDNCEHVIADAAAAVTRLLEGAPGLQVLATSREPLAIDGEAVFRLQTLDYPASADALDAQAALGYPATQLLVRRAGLVLDGYTLRDADVAAAVEICRRLDGIPLAIVLAAAQLRAMRLDEVAQSLDRRFDVLTGGPRDAGVRQRTLRAMVGWSVDLLGPEEQDLFARIGVFAGPATAEDIAAVCGVGGREPLVSSIVSLTDKSLLNVHQSDDGPTRYGYYETTRHFALERLGADNAVRRRHASHMAAILKRAEAELEVSSDAWQEVYRPYLDDVRAAVAWSLSADGDSKLAVELVARGATLFEELSFPAERRELVERAAALPNAADDPGMLGRLTLWRAMRASWVVWDNGLALEAAALFAKSGEALWEGRSRAVGAASSGYIGEQTWPSFEAAERLLRPMGNTRSLSNMLRYKATVLIWQKQPRQAQPVLDEATRIADTIGYFTGSVRARATLCEVAFDEGDVKKAIALSIADVAAVSERGGLGEVQMATTFLAGYRLIGGEVEAAGDALLQLFAIDRRLGDLWAMRLHVELTAFYLGLRGDLVTATALMAFFRRANSESDRQAERFQEVMRERLQQLLAPLSQEARSEAEARGADWSLDEAVAVALEKLTRR